MVNETLWKDGSASTCVSYDDYNNRIVVNHGSSAGDYYTYIREESWPKLQAALTENDTPSTFLDRLRSAFNDNRSAIDPEDLAASLAARFLGREEDPYTEIENFLKENDVDYRSDYWVGDR